MNATPPPSLLKEIVHNFVVPMVLGFMLTALKIITDLRDFNWDEANGIALDLILVSIGAFSIYMKGKDVETIVSAGVGNALLALVLLYIRYKRARKRDKLPAGQTLPEMSGWLAVPQLLLGITSIYWTMHAI